MKKIIKISCAGTTTAWSDHRNPLIFKFLPASGNVWKNCEFFLNDVSIKTADYWVIIGDVDVAAEECEVDPMNVILMTGEPSTIKRYDVSADFINQFGRVFTSQENVNHARVFPCRSPLNWWIDGGSPIKSKDEFDRWKGDGLSYDDFKKLREIKKDKVLSVFCSNKIFTEGHKNRFNFCQKVKSHFKDKVDWFGNGVNPLESKWDGVAPYKYHIALENFNGPNYLTEKLMDPLMVLSHPIYHGATNIREYFSSDQVSVIDIRYPKTAIAKIEELIDGSFYEKNFDSLLSARDLAMDKYNFYNIISDIVESDEKADVCKSKNRLITIKQEKFFLPTKSNSEVKLRKNFPQRMRKSLGKKIVKIRNFLIDHVLFVKHEILNLHGIVKDYSSKN